MIIERELFNHIKNFISSPEAVVITGMRRVGKTTFLRFIFDQIETNNKVFIDLENPFHQKIFDEENYDKIYDNLISMGLSNDSPKYVFIDEVQIMRNLPNIIKYLFDRYRIKFFLTGSASYYLRNFFSESLSGRKFLFELYPFSFTEYLKAKGARINLSEAKEVTPFIFEQFDKHYSEYIQFGGFPQVVLRETVEEKKKMLNDIITSYFNLDVTRLAEFRKLSAIRDLIFLIINRAGSRVDISKLASEIGVSRETISNYLLFLEETYFIKMVRPFTKNIDVEIRSQPKVYLCDTGIVTHFSRADEGAVFENAVLLSLLRRGGQINYYQKKTGVEIDFIYNQETAYEVKINPAESDLKRLKRLSGELGIKEYYIVSKRFKEMKNIKYGFQI